MAKPGGRHVAGAILIVACLAASVAVWMARRPPDLAREAKSAYEAYLRADGNELLRYAFPQDVKANELTELKLTRLYKEVILPKFPDIAGRKPGRIAADSSHGECSATVRSAKGGAVDFLADVYLGDSGVCSPLTGKVFLAWIKAFNDEFPPGNPALDRVDAVISGLKMDREKLDSIGIRALCDVDYVGGGVTMIPIDTLEQRYREWRVKLQESQSSDLRPRGYN